MEKYASPPDIKRLINRPRTEFWNYNLVGLTHEMKSPLAVIEGALEVLQKPRSAYSNGHSDYLGMIQRNIQRLKISVNDLLGMYTVGHNHHELCFRSVDLVKLCKGEMDRYRPAVELKGLSFEGASLDRLPLKVRCDASKIRLVISNLLSNSIKFTKKGSIQLGIQAADDFVIVFVEDTGIGISEENLPFVFDGFFQAENQNTKGSGIGLTISRIWIKAHNGDIYATSNGIGKGARFWFKIPMS